MRIRLLLGFTVLCLAACGGAGADEEDAGTGADAGAPGDDGGASDDAGPVDDGGALSCPSGFADCNGDPADGCEVNTREDSAHCGGCGMACDASTSACRAEACIEGRCESVDLGPDTVCRPARGPCDVPERCDGSGTCSADAVVEDGTACPDDGDVCTLDVCQSGTCAHPPIDFETNPDHCGGCGFACPADTTCEGGRCQLRDPDVSRPDARCAPGSYPVARPDLGTVLANFTADAADHLLPEIDCAPTALCQSVYFGEPGIYAGRAELAAPTEPNAQEMPASPDSSRELWDQSVQGYMNGIQASWRSVDFRTVDGAVRYTDGDLRTYSDTYGSFDYFTRFLPGSEAGWSPLLLMGFSFDDVEWLRIHGPSIYRAYRSAGTVPTHEVNGPYVYGGYRMFYTAAYDAATEWSQRIRANPSLFRMYVAREETAFTVDTPAGTDEQFVRTTARFGGVLSTERLYVMTYAIERGGYMPEAHHEALFEGFVDTLVCAPCPPGYESPTRGGDACRACAPGTYGDVAGGSCTPCEGERVAAAHGATECTPCEAPRVANDAKTACVDP